MWRARRGHGRPHQHRHADLLLRHQRRAAARGSDRRHQARRSRRPTASAAKSVVQQELRGRGCGPGEPARSEGPADAITSKFEIRPTVPAEAPDFVRNVEGADDCGQWRPSFRSALCRSTAPTPPARHSGRSATSRWRFRYGTSNFASSAANASWSARTPSSAPRCTTRTAVNHAPDGFKTAAAEVARVHRPEVHAAGCA